MPLQAHHHKAIQEVVTRGKDLPATDAGALLAAYECAERNAAANRQQISTLQTQVFDLTKERDETQRLRREVESEIDRRVALRTESLAAETEQAKEDMHRFQDRARRNEDNFNESVQFYRKTLHTAARIITRLSTEIEVSPAWWRRWSARRHHQKMLEQCDKELPFSVVETWLHEHATSAAGAPVDTMQAGTVPARVDTMQDDPPSRWKKWAT